MEDKRVKIILAVVLSVIAIRISCFQLSIALAEKHFGRYLQEYNIDKNEIESYSANKSFIFENVSIRVEYVNDGGVQYDYEYPIHSIFYKPVKVGFHRDSHYYGLEEYIKAGYTPKYPVETRK